jgi:hypothetical protein
MAVVLLVAVRYVKSSKHYFEWEIVDTTTYEKSGTLVAKQINGSAIIHVEISNNADVELSVYLISGDCLAQGPVNYHITALRTGKSSTTMAFGLRTLVNKLPMAVVIYDNPDRSGKILYCGNLDK